jgi:hypothetical protein
MSMHSRVLALALLAASCTSVSVIPRYGRLDIGGHIGMNSTSSGASGTNDLKDAGLVDDTSVPSGRVDLELGGTHTTFELSDSSHDGSGRLTADVSDGTTTIPAGTAVDSKLGLVLGEAIVTWDFVPGDLVEAGLGIGVSGFDVDTRFTAPSLSASVGAHAFLPVPIVAGRAGLDFGRFDVSALLGGMDVHVDGKDATVVDLDVMARLKIIGAVGKRIGAIVLGYRYTDMKLDYSDSDKKVDADMRFSGPYIGLSVGF